MDMNKSIIALNALNCLKLQHNSLFHVSRQKAKWHKAFLSEFCLSLLLGHLVGHSAFVHLCVCVGSFVGVYCVCLCVCVCGHHYRWWWWQDTGWCHPCPRWQRFTPWNIPDSPSFCLFPGSPASFDQCTFSPPFFQTYVCLFVPWLSIEHIRWYKTKPTKSTNKTLLAVFLAKLGPSAHS